MEHFLVLISQLRSQIPLKSFSTLFFQLNSIFNRFFQNSYQPQQAPKISLGNTASNKFNDESDNARKNSSAGENEKKNSSPVKKPEAKKVTAQEGSQGSGWFGGIFNKLSMKPKNQMILPDDKNPTVSLAKKFLI